MNSINLRQLASVYLRIGNTTFGGGDPTILALRRELVERRGVLTESQFSLSYTLSRITPGTNILAFCAGTGFQLRGWRGAAAGVALVAVPSSILAVAVTGVYQAWMTHPVGAAAINATLAAAVGMMFAGAWLIVRPQLRYRAAPRTAAILALSFALSWWGDLSPLKTMAVAALVGILWREPAG